MQVITPRRKVVPFGAIPRSATDGLAEELTDAIEGEVRFDQGSRALYATDLSLYRQVPIGVVIPRTLEDVVTTVAACQARGVPILGRGCGSSLAGQACNVAVVIDCSKYLNHITELDPHAQMAWVEPGVILDTLRDAAEQYALTLAPDPATHAWCTLGGMLGNNSCGVHSVLGAYYSGTGLIADFVEELDILTYDGLRLRVGSTTDAEYQAIQAEGGRKADLYRGMRALRDRYGELVRERYPKIPRRVSGYNLNELLPENGFNVARALVGTEGTCAMILGARVRLVPSPQAKALVIIGYPDLATAADAVPELMRHRPIGLEAFEDLQVKNMARKGHALPGAKLLPEGGAWILLEVGADTEREAADRAREIEAFLSARPGKHLGVKSYYDAEQQEQVWQARESGVGASRIPGEWETWPGWEDAAAPPDRLGDYLRAVDRLLEKYDYQAIKFGHFGQGCVHMRTTFDLKTADGVRHFRSFMEEAADLVVSLGGSLSGEHGDGQSRGELLVKLFGPELIDAFREFKALWDPQGKMNPGKVVDAYPLDSNLRTGPDYSPLRLTTHFQYPEDNGSFAHAAERCFGVGRCRRLDGGTMCPSFMVTHEEQYTTRGRAHLLFEMVRGEAITDGWQSEAVKDALDLCLACKGCKGDCPVSTDIATYKAEFLSHYYEGHQRPRSAYALGLIFYWARLATRLPGVVNVLTHAPVLRDVAKRLAGIAPDRSIPNFAPQSFQSWYRNRPRHNLGQPQVLLWPDTFNNYFFTETAKAAVAVLEDAGFEVLVPQASLCCGRPLYDYGMLDLAKRLLIQILDTLRPYIQAGVPLVGLEPSCVAVFRDELHGLLPTDEDANRLTKQTFTLAEFLTKKAPHYRPARMERNAVVQGHCHQKAVLGMEADEQVMAHMGLTYQVLDSGCCGMAGSFGFEAGEHYEVSVKAGERVLLPVVRQAPASTLVIANGFSCREQIAQGSNRHALHLADVLALAKRSGPSGPSGGPPEQHQMQPAAHLSGREAALALASGGAITLGAAAAAAGAYRRARSR